MKTAFTTVCHCGELLYVVADDKDFAAWESGVPVQKAMPYLSPSDREILISSTCEKCWDRMFGEWD
jgi:hypothetical protein